MEHRTGIASGRTGPAFSPPIALWDLGLAIALEARKNLLNAGHPRAYWDNSYAYRRGILLAMLLDAAQAVVRNRR